MRFLDFRKSVAPFTVFSLIDIGKIDVNFDRRRLIEWQNKGYIKKIIRGYYMLTETEITESVRVAVANKIYRPSYVSLESALSHYNLIPESTYGLTSVTTRKTQSFKTSLGVFSYQSLKKNLYFGYRLNVYSVAEVRFAQAEKAVLDFLYLHSDYDNVNAFHEWRLNLEMFKEIIDRDRLKDYVSLYQNQALTQRTNLLLNFVDHKLVV